MDREKFAGLYANISAVKAERQIMFKNLAKTDPNEVQDLYMEAFDNEKLAMEMKLRVIEAQMINQ